VSPRTFQTAQKCKAEVGHQCVHKA
jgi:hypothetical protein